MADCFFLILIPLTRAAIIAGLLCIWWRTLRSGLFEVAMASLLTNHLIELLLMLGLSLAECLRPRFYLPIYSCSALLLAYCGIRQLSKERCLDEFFDRISRGIARVPRLALVVGSLSLILLVVRALFFFDTTYDCLTYGLTKLALYAQHQSVFFLSQLPDLRIDANERNGELVFFHHLLMTGDIRWLSIGGVDVWISIVCALTFLLRVMNLQTGLAMSITLLIALCPAVFGLSGVSKGDALAAGYIVAATAWLLMLPSCGVVQARLFLFVAALSLALTCKLTTVLPAAALSAIGVLALWKRRTFPTATTLLWIWLMGLVAFSKAIQNIVVYHNPFIRSSLERESAVFHWQNLTAGLAVCTRWFLGLQADSLPTGFHFELSMGMGLAGTVGLLCLAVGWCWPRRCCCQPVEVKSAAAENRMIGLVAVALLVSSVALTSLVPVQRSEFATHWMRFLLPCALALTAICFAIGCRRLEASPLAFCNAISILACYHWYCASNSSGTMHHAGRKDLAQQILHYDRQRARFGCWTWMDEDLHKWPQFTALEKQNLKVLVLIQGGNVPLWWLFGDNLNWQAAFVHEAEFTPQHLDVTDIDRVIVVDIYRVDTGMRWTTQGVKPEIADILSRHGWVPDMRLSGWVIWRRSIG